VTFRGRLTGLAAGAVAVAVALASAVVFFVVRDQLRRELDSSLVAIAREVRIRESPLTPLFPETPLGVPAYAQLVRFDGAIFPPEGLQAVLHAGAAAEAVAAGRARPFFSDVEVGSTDVRVLTTQAAPGLAVQVARSLEETQNVLRRLALVLVLISVGGAAVAALLGRGVAHATLRPVRRLTEAAERVTATGDLSRRIRSEGEDELARLAASFNTMLEALESSLTAQRSLVADASHELRTPLTSIRTNIEVLERAGERLPEAERKALVGDVVGELEELTKLVSDVVELARGVEPPHREDDAALDELVERAVERARARHSPRVRFAVEAEPAVVRGVPDRIDRAVANLLDNAAKWSPEGASVAVRVGPGVVEVSDEGPGIDDADKARVFDRFYRAPSARGQAGSGLGLAIVRQVAESHGGRVEALDAAGGGARLVLRLPEAPVDS
jgi:two-component system, OmpR family, sensor histidine kinase MprB